MIGIKGIMVLAGFLFAAVVGGVVVFFQLLFQLPYAFYPAYLVLGNSAVGTVLGLLIGYKLVPKEHSEMRFTISLLIAIALSMWSLVAVSVIAIA